MSDESPVLAARKRAVQHSALKAFAASGYASTPVTTVAADAGISTAYLMKLFTRKVDVFIAAVDFAFEQIVTALAEEIDDKPRRSVRRTLDALGARYAALIGDRSLLLIQVQAQANAHLPEIADALRRGMANLVDLLLTQVGASPAQAQEFVARGMLCHLLTSIDAFDVRASWATALTNGIDHTSV
ncbi:TetR/AcrR family transcriptional regulator [Flexivirga sp. B27]